MPAHHLCVSQKRFKLERYWDYRNIQVCHQGTFDERIEELFHVFQSSVKARLRSEKPVAATLSGGLDSSSICAIAAELYKEKNKHLRTYTHFPLFDPSNALDNSIFGNEKPFVEAMKNRYENIDTCFLNSESISPLEGIDRGYKMAAFPFHTAINAYWLIDIYETAKTDGYGSLILGEFGNATLSLKLENNFLPFSTLFKKLGILRAVKHKYIRWACYGDHILGRNFKNAFCKKSDWRSHSYLNEEFAEKIQFSKKIKESGFDSTFKRYFKNLKDYQNTILSYNELRLILGAHFGLANGIEFRDPTSDTRMIECCLKMPPSFYEGEQDRWVARKMMEGRLPDCIRLNTGRGRQSSDIGARLEANRAEIEARINAIKTNNTKDIIDINRIESDWNKLMSPIGTNNYNMGELAHIIRAISIDTFINPQK